MSKNDSGYSYYKVFDESQNISIQDIPEDFSICVTKQGYVPFLYNVRLIQNQIITGKNDFCYDVFKLGSNLTSQKSSGPVIIENGQTTIEANSTVLAPGTIVKKGAKLIITSK